MTSLENCQLVNSQSEKLIHFLINWAQIMANDERFSTMWSTANQKSPFTLKVNQPIKLARKSKQTHHWAFHMFCPASAGKRHKSVLFTHVSLICLEVFLQMRIQDVWQEAIAAL